jgi:hypothetical protein
MTKLIDGNFRLGRIRLIVLFDFDTTSGVV